MVSPDASEPRSRGCEPLHPTASAVAAAASSIGTDPSVTWRHPGAAPAFHAKVAHAISGPMPDYEAIRTIDSQHLRAARALLGWAMSDLAAVSGLSLSTIRRLEQSARSVSPRNHQAAVDALRTGGIRFLLLDDGTTALAEVGRASSALRRSHATGDAARR